MEGLIKIRGCEREGDPKKHLFYALKNSVFFLSSYHKCGIFVVELD